MTHCLLFLQDYYKKTIAPHEDFLWTIVKSSDTTKRPAVPVTDDDRQSKRQRIQDQNTVESSKSVVSFGVSEAIMAI